MPDSPVCPASAAGGYCSHHLGYCSQKREGEGKKERQKGRVTEIEREREREREREDKLKQLSYIFNLQI